MVAGLIHKYAQSNKEMALKIQELKMCLADERRVNFELNRDLTVTSQEYSKLMKVSKNILERVILIGSVINPFIEDAQQIMDTLPNSVGVRLNLQTQDIDKLPTFRNKLGIIHETETTYQNPDVSIVPEGDSLNPNSIPITRASRSGSKVDSLTVIQDLSALNDSSIYEKVEFDSSWDIFQTQTSPKRKKTSIDTQENELLPSCSYKSHVIHETSITESPSLKDQSPKEEAKTNDNNVAIEIVKKVVVRKKKFDDRVEFENSHRSNGVRQSRRTVSVKNLKEPSLRVKMRRD